MSLGYLQPELYSEDQYDESHVLDLNLSTLECYSVSSTSSLQSIHRCFLDETRNCKRLKVEPSIGESIESKEIVHRGCSGMRTNSSNSLRKLQFRDHIWAYTQRYLAVEAMEEAAAAIMQGDQSEMREEGNGDAMKLVQRLIACAEAVACRDKTHASALLSELSSKALVFGTSFQRVASCFVQGLVDRLALVQPSGAVGIVGQSAREMVMTNEKEEALRLVYEICPYIQFSHFIANESILEAFEGESSIHVVDLGMTQGLPHVHQWRNLISSLAKRPGSSSRCLKISGVGNCEEGLQTIGDKLKHYAKGLGVNFEFLMVQSNLENLQAEDFSILEGEVLVINSILQLHCLVKESRGALNSVLQILHKLLPKLLVLVEQDSSHNGPFFLGRFMEALHYYSAIFDALDAMLPKYDTRRAKIEQFFFAEEIKNIVSCEGPARVERHERIDQWRRRMSRAGFQSAPIKMLTKAKQWLAKFKVCEGYTIVEEKGCLVLGWNSKPIIAASCWKCS
ncbi:GRAS family protein RAD1 [Eucalyptus grandis]|uniref:GRAS family protein RAD1 n=1 Tax=Eucalyptus grandis TaxID=71139 RepID=UPI00192EEC1A|nr:GRAS family protein RAD1 [Eucalyptus grandis]